jgi:hypothetical protein
LRKNYCPTDGGALTSQPADTDRDTTTMPRTRESIFKVGLSQVWRFRADFKRRFIISTSEMGGVYVTDMDDEIETELWRNEEVREFAHLEYDMETGTAAWDAFGDVVELWRIKPGERGVFEQVEVLEHDCQTRGFQIGHGDLSVVSSEGWGFVYEFHPVVRLKKKIEIAERAVGHLCQDREVVMFSMGERGYHIHSKETGQLLGVLDPSHCMENINHAPHDHVSSAITQRPLYKLDLPIDDRTDCLARDFLKPGPHPARQDNASLGDDEWGAGLLDGDTMAGISRNGRVFICSNWREVLSSGDYGSTSSITECQTNRAAFDMCGWLSLRNGKVAVEVNDCVYLMNASPTKRGQEESRPIWAMRTSMDFRSREAVSFMSIWDDCFMYTYVVSFVPYPHPHILKKEKRKQKVRLGYIINFSNPLPFTF